MFAINLLLICFFTSNTGGEEVKWTPVPKTLPDSQPTNQIPDTLEDAPLDSHPTGIQQKNVESNLSEGILPTNKGGGKVKDSRKSALDYKQRTEVADVPSTFATLSNLRTAVDTAYRINGGGPGDERRRNKRATRKRNGGRSDHVRCGGTGSELVSKGCEIYLQTNIPGEPPLILQNGKLVLPEKRGQMQFIAVESGAVLELVCHGQSNKLKDIGKQSIKVTCSSALFQHGKEKWHFAQFLCIKPVTPKYKINDGCGDLRRNDLVTITVIWDLGGPALKQYSVCYDRRNQEPIYTNHRIDGVNIATGINWNRPQFNTDRSLVTNDIRPNYQIYAKQDTIFSGFGVWEEKYFDRNRNRDIGKFLSKGHLVPKADFIWKAMQDATFSYINVAAQYQMFNDGNWNNLEMAVRLLAGSLKRDLEVYTGTYETLELKQPSGEIRKLTLPGTNVGVPRFFWKVLFDRRQERSIAIVGINNPFLTESDLENYMLCEDKWEKVKWIATNNKLRETRKDFSKGYIYCCTVEDLRQHIKTIPSYLQQREILSHWWNNNSGRRGR